MSICPIENRVKLTYNAVGGDKMAEFCLDCWNRLNHTSYTERDFILSEELELCEGCAKFKPIILAERKTQSLWHKILFFDFFG